MTVQNTRLVLRLALMLFSIAILGSRALPVGAAGPSTLLKFLPLEPVAAGVEAIVHAQLLDGYGRPIADQAIEFYVDDIARGRVLTDPAGIANYALRADLPAGTHVLKASFRGSGEWSSSVASAEVAVLPPNGTRIVIEPLAPLARGQHATLIARLTDAQGKPLADEPVDLYLDDARERRAWTNPSGILSFPLGNTLSPGSHHVRLVYGGSAQYAPATAQSSIVVQPPAVLTLAIEPVSPLLQGERPLITARLTTKAGAAVVDQQIVVYVAGTRERQVWTNPAGIVAVRLSDDLPPGTHIVKLVFEGTPTFAPASASIDLVVKPPTPTTIVIEPVAPVVVGESIELNLTLVDSAGAPVGDQPVDLYLDDTRERRIWTDSRGQVSMRAVRNLNAGTHTFKGVFGGAVGLAPASQSLDFFVKPARLRIRTVPPLPRIRFALGGRTFESDADGIASLEAAAAGTYRLEVLSTEEYGPDTRLEFVRWSDDVFESARDITMPTAGEIDAGFNVYHRVRLAFFDLAGQPVEANRVISVTLKGSQGTVIPILNSITGPHWLQAGRVVRRQSGLEETKLLYSLQSVFVEGSNVVSQAQQRFYVSREDDWQIKLLLYTVRIMARDALFGGPIGTAVRVEYPSRRREDIPLGANGDVVLQNLARGPYRFTVLGAAGNAPPTPADVSRDQDVVLKVLSVGDMLLGVGVLGLIGFGLLFTGRPRLLFALHPAALLRLASRAWRSGAIRARTTKAINWLIDAFRALRARSQNTPDAGRRT